jgi:hypothetical protein
MAVAADYVDPETTKGRHLDYELWFGRDDRYRFAVDGAQVTVTPADGMT